MDIIKENRWVAPMLSVLLVCIVGISLYSEVQNKNKISEAVIYNSIYWSGIGERSMQQDRISSMHFLKGSDSPVPTGEEMHRWRQIESAPMLLNQVEEMKQRATAEAKRAAQIQKAEAAKKAAAVTATSQTHTPPNKIFFTRTHTLTQAEQAKSTWSYSVKAEEVLLLQKIVMAEAEGEPYEGKVAVANVVLNRLRSANFPDTIQNVIYQKAQFSPVANGRLRRVQPNEDCIRAVNEALNGVKAVPDNTYYFLSLTLAQDLTVHHNREKVKTIGNHTFYK